MRPLVVAAALLALPSVAPGYSVAPAVTREPSPSVHVVGAAEVRDLRVTVRCASSTLLERVARCRVEARYELVAAERTTLTINALPDEAVRFDGAAATARTLDPGGSTRVTVSATRSIETRTTLREGPFVIPPMFLRHLLFGDTAGVERHPGVGAVVPFSGESVTVVGAVALDASGGGVEVHAIPSAVTVTSGRDPTRRPGPGEHGPVERRLTVSMVVRARTPSAGPLRHGGPVLAAGARSAFSTDRARFLLRGAWEASLWEYAFLSASVETDFESLYESVLVDLSSPSLAVVIPSVRAGVGLVGRQLGPRPADFALRLRVGANPLPVGVDVDFDYWPAIQGWTLSIAGRVSL